MTAPVLAARIGAPADSETVHRGAGWITVIAGGLAALMARKTQARHVAEALGRLNDHVLQDIGLSRAEVLHTVLFESVADAGQSQLSEASEEP
jgi:hypothetical protein